VEKKYIDETRQGEAYAIADLEGNTKKLFLESYGCQMNFSDSEIVASILQKNGYNTTTVLEEADLILLNTCSVREKAEQTVRMRLSQFKTLKKLFGEFVKLKLKDQVLSQLTVKWSTNQSWNVLNA